MRADIRYDFTDYSIPTPQNHPAGLYWYHPHAHGLALNQISADSGGIITIGSLSSLSGINVRHMIPKDSQILPNGTLQVQGDPGFCSPAPMAGEAPRQGICQGQNNSAGGGWHFTINGQEFQTDTVQVVGGKIWRMANVSGSVTHNLELCNPHQSRQILFQVLSIDGVSVAPAAGTSTSQLREVAGAKFVPEPCRGGPFGSTSQEPLCTRRVHMMPSARVEVWVNYSDSNDAVATPPAGSYALLRTSGYQTGPSGDFWPTIGLAHLDFQGSVGGGASTLLTAKGEANKVQTSRALSADMASANSAVMPDVTCQLPPGHKRRIFYAVPTTKLSAFGLAYEEVDETGRVVGRPATDVVPFDPMEPTLYVPLGPGNSPVTERWELVNLATEDHTFRSHQSKFRVLSKDEVDGTVLPGEVPGTRIMLANLPLAHAPGQYSNNPPDDHTTPIADWRAGLCRTIPIVVEIPIAIAGDYVYHCHILEHEDGGRWAVSCPPNTMAGSILRGRLTCTRFSSASSPSL